jgi:type II secretion system protein H
LQCERGFTLIEILVVIAIIAITAGLAALGLDGDERGAAAREARRFAGALEHASARAQSRAETLGVSADGGGWRFWRRPAEARRWFPVADDDQLAAHAVPPGMSVSPLSFAGQALPADAIVPLRASGRNEPFAFLLSARSSRIVLAADPLNRVSIQTETLSPGP